MSDVAAEIEAGLDALGEEFRARFTAAPDEQALRAARAEVLGKKGELTALLKRLGQVPGDQRRAIGERVNGVKLAAEAEFERALGELARRAREAELTAPPFDLTLPGRVPAPLGHVHPITQMRHRVLDIFASLGFEVAWGPEVDLEENNFTKLAFPPDHPATDMQDTFWVRVDPAASGTAASPQASPAASEDVGAARALLRTHTSTVQVREMLRRSPPMAVVSGGAVYRRDDDVTHSPMFHQVEGFLVAERTSFAELRGVLTAFAERLYGPGTPVRFRPSYFPFVEPGAEVDVGCVFCSPDDDSRAACRVCKATGWLEVLGCGMIHPAVFEHCGIDPERWSGFAFGVGIERLAMLRHGIPDIRLLFENDPRFLAQF